MITKEIQEACKLVYVHVGKWTKDKCSIDPDDRQGACAISSYAIYRYLKYKGYAVEFVMAMDLNDCEGHCYVEFGDYIIDLSCKQFNNDLPDILVIKKEKYIIELPKVKDYVRIAKGRIAISQFKEWNFEQNPITYRHKIDYLVRKAA